MVDVIVVVVAAAAVVVVDINGKLGYCYCVGARPKSNSRRILDTKFNTKSHIILTEMRANHHYLNSSFNDACIHSYMYFEHFSK